MQGVPVTEWLSLWKYKITLNAIPKEDPLSKTVGILGISVDAGKMERHYFPYKQKIKLCFYRLEVFSVVICICMIVYFNFLSLNVLRENSRNDLKWWFGAQ